MPLARLIFLHLFLMASSLATIQAALWQKTTWRGEAAWSSIDGDLQAIVSEARCRLIYFGAADGSQNLLCAPNGTDLPNAKEQSPNWGGHRFWLGPQRRWVWPALREWEHSPCESAMLKDEVLFLRHQQLKPDYPRLTREYAWEQGRLRCTVSWMDDGRPYYGMHVIAVSTPLVTQARLLAWDEVPEGLVEVQMEHSKTKGLLPHPALEIQNGTATLRSGVKGAKCGFYPQALVARRDGAWTLSVINGPHQGTPLTSPDFGYLTQVWVGVQEDFAELEQLTPYLKGDAEGRCSSTLYLEARR